MPRRRRPVGDVAQRMRCTADAAVAAACAGDGGRSACTASRSGKGSPRVRVLRERFLGYWRRGFTEYSVRRGRYGVVSTLHRQQPLWAWWLRRAFIASTNTIRPSAARDCLHMFGGGCVRECVCMCVRVAAVVRACVSGDSYYGDYRASLRPKARRLRCAADSHPASQPDPQCQGAMRHARQSSQTLNLKPQPMNRSPEPSALNPQL
jgi:hypothetical protein